MQNRMLGIGCRKVVAIRKRRRRPDRYMKVSPNVGTWPAFWMLSPSKDMEIDIVEQYGHDPNHYWATSHDYANGPRDCRRWPCDSALRLWRQMISRIGGRSLQERASTSIFLIWSTRSLIGIFISPKLAPRKVFDRKIDNFSNVSRSGV
jgi:Glycosyl hydrolases family 16